MKFMFPALVALCFLLPTSTMAGQHPYQPHPGCSKAGYTCILKVVDGQPFYCMKTVSKRARNVRNHPSKITEVKCVERFPAIPYKPASQPEEE